MRFPQVVTLPVSDLVTACKQWLEQEVGVQPGDTSRVILGLPQLLVVNRERAGEKLSLLAAQGFTRGEIAGMVKQCPGLLGLTSESLQVKLGYLRGGAGGGGTEEIVEYPQCLLAPLKVLQVRVGEARRRGVACSLQWMMDCDEEGFRTRLRAASRQ